MLAEEMLKTAASRRTLLELTNVSDCFSIVREVVSWKRDGTVLLVCRWVDGCITVHA
jgi:hypothetical protein